MLGFGDWGEGAEGVKQVKIYRVTDLALEILLGHEFLIFYMVKEFLTSNTNYNLLDTFEVISK